MLKRIALAAVFIAAAAITGASIAKARAPQIQVTPQTPKGFCMPPHWGC
jgi:hypothetical protein